MAKIKKRKVSALAKLTPAQVRYARERHSARKITQVQLAAKFHMTQPAISNMLRRKTYQEVV